MEINCEKDNYVRHCRFHPLEPKLACALQNGRVCVFISESSASFVMNWRKVLLQAVTNSHVSKIDWSIDGTQLAAGSEDGTMILWKENDEMSEDGIDEPSVWNYGHIKSLEVRKHSRSATCVHWNKENNGGHLLATGDLTGKIIVWDSILRRNIGSSKKHQTQVNDICWIAKDTLASCSKDCTIFVHKIGGRTLHKFQNNDGVYSLRWNSILQRLVFCPRGSLKIWSPEMREPVVVLDAEFEKFSFDWHCTRSRTTLARSSGCIVQVSHLIGLEITNVIELRARHQASVIMCAAFSPNGRFIAVLDRRGFIDIWFTETWRQVSSVNIDTKWRNSKNELTWDSTSRILALSSGCNVVIVFSQSDTNNHP